MFRRNRVHSRPPTRALQVKPQNEFSPPPPPKVISWFGFHWFGNHRWSILALPNHRVSRSWPMATRNRVWCTVSTGARFGVFGCRRSLLLRLMLALPRLRLGARWSNSWTLRFSIWIGHILLSERKTPAIPGPHGLSYLLFRYRFNEAWKHYYKNKIINMSMWNVVLLVLMAIDRRIIEIIECSYYIVRVLDYTPKMEPILWLTIHDHKVAWT